MRVLLFFFILTICSAKLFVTLTFDDAWKEHYDASVLLDSYGLKATFYCNSGRIGANQYMQLDKIVDIQTRGHEVGGHTVGHLNLTSLSDEDRLFEICQDYKNFRKHNVNVDSFAFPFGAKFDGSDAILKGCGFASGRVSGGLYTNFSCPVCASGNRMPIKDDQKYELRSISYRHHMHAEGLKLIIERGLKTTIAQDQWIILIFHRIANFTSQEATDLFYNTFNPDDDTTNSTINIIQLPDLTEFLQYLVDRKIDVRMVREIIKPLPITTTPATVPPTTKPSGAQLLYPSLLLICLVAAVASLFV